MSIPSLETVNYSVDDDVAIIEINRPDRMNTLGGTLKQDLEAAFFTHARADPRVRAVVLTAVGDKAFCAGADIKERATRSASTFDYFVAQEYTHTLFRRIETFERPVICAINGVALGGGLELAMCADIRIAADHARLGLTEVRLGAIPAAGGTQRLTRLVGEGIAKEMVFTSAMLSADEAKAIRLVNRVTTAQTLRDTAMELARQIAGQPPLAVAFAKQTMNSGLQVGIDEGLIYERYAAAILANSEDRKEGFQAFAEKRKPVFRGG
ncbi:MAG: enoyl-CoA hydratase/isomerase family protein [Pararhodobacter sp.]|nr:enoyl-CoA hydratase/isomerase family protein [Pararhodobacter sp.]